MSEPAPQRYPTRAAAERLRNLLDILYEDWMQDWPLEISDSKRLAEFCDAYEAEELDTESRFALMQLILYSLDDLLRDRNRVGNETTEEGEIIVKQRVERLLRQDFVLHLHTLDYWCLHDEPDPEDENDPEYVFAVTPPLRRIWKECYKPEYDRWLDGET
jgi:hypothetical protein